MFECLADIGLLVEAGKFLLDQRVLQASEIYSGLNLNQDKAASHRQYK